MKCPLLTAGFLGKEKWKEEVNIDCLKEECAWWDRTAEKCAVLQLAFELDDVHCQLEEVANKMTHAG